MFLVFRFNSVVPVLLQIEMVSVDNICILCTCLYSICRSKSIWEQNMSLKNGLTGLPIE